MRQIVVGGIVALLLLCPAVARATPILINPGATLAANADALAAFNRAADRWGAIFSDPITVYIDADLVNLGSTSIIGQTGSVLLQADYTTIRDQMVADAADEEDDAIVAKLPTISEVSAFVPGGFRLVDAMVATKANLKAMGFEDLDAIFGDTDATIEFNSMFPFDYDNSDGVAPGLIDFETVATHEIGHALGFTSFVDQIDLLEALGRTGAVAFEPLDLFRFSTIPGLYPTNGTEFTNTPRLLLPGYSAMFDDVAHTWELSTGQFTGDGRQASHWKDNNLSGRLIGIMDPTLARQQIFPLTDADIRALDVIGWDARIPEPATVMLFGLGLAAAIRRRARSR